jgi:gamma-glutamylcysteine synthetase
MTTLSMPKIDMTEVTLLTIAIKDNYDYVRYVALKARFPMIREVTLSKEAYNEAKLLFLLED